MTLKIYMVFYRLQLQQQSQLWNTKRHMNWLHQVFNVVKQFGKIDDTINLLKFWQRPNRNAWQTSPNNHAWYLRRRWKRLCKWLHLHFQGVPWPTGDCLCDCQVARQPQVCVSWNPYWKGALIAIILHIKIASLVLKKYKFNLSNRDDYWKTSPPLWLVNFSPQLPQNKS
jgi:hypothetical protein